MHFCISGIGPESDYDSTSVALTFDEAISRQCVDIPIIDDDDIEIDERFTVSLETNDPNTTLDPRTGVVIIENDDGML